MRDAGAYLRSHREFPNFLTLSPVAFLVYHSPPPAPNPQHGEAKKPYFQLGEGKGENKLENTISSSLGVMSIWLCLCVTRGRFLTLSGLSFCKVRELH